MSEVLPALGQIAALVLLLALTVPLLGRYLAHIYTSDRHLAPERVAYRVLRVDPDADQHWRSYAMSVLGLQPGRDPGALRRSAGSSSTCRSRSASPRSRPRAPGTPPSAS